MRLLLAAGALLPLALLATASAAPGAAAATPGNAVYTTADGASTGHFSFSGPCNGQVTLTLTLDGVSGDGSTIIRTAQSKMVPDLCNIACLDCPVPFAWTLKGDGVDLAGGGVAPAFSLQGVYADGALEVHGPV